MEETTPETSYMRDKMARIRTLLANERTFDSECYGPDGESKNSVDQDTSENEFLRVSG